MEIPLTWGNRFSPPRVPAQNYRAPESQIRVWEVRSHTDLHLLAEAFGDGMRPGLLWHWPEITQSWLRELKDTKGHLILGMEGSCPVMPTPTGITDSYLQCQLVSDSMVPWPQTRSLCLREGSMAGQVWKTWSPRPAAPCLLAVHLGE